jgi:hypothetical protein
MIKMVGRSDDDLNGELQVQVQLSLGIRPNLDSVFGYTHFRFRYATSAQEAFERECLEYHATFEQLDNKRHPTRDDGTGQRVFCPIWQCAWNY